jgi:hypothetical protein
LFFCSCHTLASSCPLSVPYCCSGRSPSLSLHRDGTMGPLLEL